MRLAHVPALTVVLTCNTCPHRRRAHVLRGSMDKLRACRQSETNGREAIVVMMRGPQQLRSIVRSCMRATSKFLAVARGQWPAQPSTHHCNGCCIMHTSQPQRSRGCNCQPPPAHGSPPRHELAHTHVAQHRCSDPVLHLLLASNPHACTLSCPPHKSPRSSKSIRSQATRCSVSARAGTTCKQG